MSPVQHARRATVLVGITVAVQAVLCATHDGEMWPLSIYPMFSSAGRPWTRVVVRDVTDVPAPRSGPLALDDLPGRPVALAPLGISPNDLAALLGGPDAVTDRETIATLRRLLAAPLRDQSLLVVRVSGRLDRGGTVRTSGEPVLRLDAEEAPR